MSDQVVGRGIIEVVADARQLRAQIAEAKKSIRTLGEGQKDVSQAASRSIDTYVGKLQTQAATIGKSARETELFKLALRGATNDQLNAANAALLVTERHAQMQRVMFATRTILLGLGAAAVASFALFAKNTIDSAAKLDDMAEVTGASVEKLSALARQARVSGTELGDVESALVKLSKGLNAVDEDSGDAARALGALGLSASSLRGLDTADAMRKIAVAMNEFSDGSGKTAAALALFGKQGAKFLPFLKDLANDAALGADTTARQAAEAENLQKNLKRLTDTSESLGRSILLDALPSLVSFTEQMLLAKRAGFGLAEALFEVARAKFVGAGDAASIIASSEEDLKRLREANEILAKLPGYQAEIAKNYRLIEEAQKRLQFGKALQVKEALDRFSGPQFQDARDLKAQQKQILDFQSTVEAQVKTIGDVAKERQKILESTITAESELVKVRLKAISDITGSTVELSRLEIDTINKRVAAATAAATLEEQIAKVRGSSAQKLNEELRASGLKLYENLTQASSNYLKTVQDNNTRILELQRGVVEAQTRASNTIANARFAVANPEQQREEIFQRSFEQERQARTALLTGNLEQVKKIQSSAEATAQAFINIGEIDFAEKFLGTINDIFATASKVEEVGLRGVNKEAEARRVSAEQQITELKAKIGQLQDTALANLKISVKDESLKEVVTQIRQAIEREEFKAKLKVEVTEISRSGSTFTETARAAGGGIVRAAGGGEIHGPGGPTGDRIPAWLSDGEFVVRAAAVRNYGSDFLHAINSMQVSRFAEGGQAGRSSPGNMQPVTLVVGRKSARVFTRGRELDRLADLLEDSGIGT